MSVADGRSLKVVGFGDIGVMFQSGESIIPMKHEAMQCGTRTRDLLQPVLAYSLFEKGARINWRSTGDRSIATVQSTRSILFEICGNLYQV